MFAVVALSMGVLTVVSLGVGTMTVRVMAMCIFAMIVVTVCVVAVGVVAMGVVTMRVTMVVRGSEKRLGVVPRHIAQNTVLDVASEESFLAERSGVLFGVDSPAHVSSEEEGTLVPGLDLLVQVELEELLRLAAAVHSYLLITDAAALFRQNFL